MKYIKTYEGVKPPFKTKVGEEYFKLKDTPYKSFSVSKLEDEYNDYNVDFDFQDLIKEIFLNKKVAFQSYFVYTYDERLNSFNSYISKKQSVIGVCKDIKFYYGEVYRSIEILLNVNSEWCQGPFNQKIRVYDYVEGPLMEELEAKKDAKKYNL